MSARSIVGGYFRVVSQLADNDGLSFGRWLTSALTWRRRGYVLLTRIALRVSVVDLTRRGGLVCEVAFRRENSI